MLFNGNQSFRPACAIFTGSLSASAFCIPLLSASPCLPGPSATSEDTWRPPAPRDRPTASHAAATWNKRAVQAFGNVTLCHAAAPKQVTKTDTIAVFFTKQNRMLSLGLGPLFVVLSATAQFPPTTQILPFSLCHLSHTEVRMATMTQRGHCFVVLFYLFRGNEKSAEGLAWCSPPHIYTHEALPRPYGSSTGGYLTPLTRWPQRHRSQSLPPFQRVVMKLHCHVSFFFLLFAVSPCDTLLSQRKCFSQ